MWSAGEYIQWTSVGTVSVVVAACCLHLSTSNPYYDLQRTTTTITTTTFLSEVDAHGLVLPGILSSPPPPWARLACESRQNPYRRINQDGFFMAFSSSSNGLQSVSQIFVGSAIKDVRTVTNMTRSERFDLHCITISTENPPLFRQSPGLFQSYSHHTTCTSVIVLCSIQVEDVFVQSWYFVFRSSSAWYYGPGSME